MPTATDLHIQSRAEGTPRVLPLSASAVRVGRGEQCEVRLADGDLAEVQCLLRRRGETWHVQPIGPPGALSVEGRVVESPRTLALGVPLRVGDHWLTLRPSGVEPAPALGSFEAPIIVPFRATEPGRPDPVEARPSLYRPAAERDPVPRRAATLAQPTRARSTTVPPSRPLPRSVPPRPPVADRPPIAPRAPAPPRAEVPSPATPAPTVDRRGLAAGSLLSRMFDLVEPPARPAAEARRAVDPPAEVAPVAAPVVEMIPVAAPEPVVVEVAPVAAPEPVVEVVALVEPEPAIIEVIPAVEPEVVEVEEPAASVPSAVVEPTDADLLGWPSASRIIGETGRGPRRAGPVAARAMPAPSASIAPGSWSLPRWVAAGPLAIALLAVGAAGVGLSMVWAQDDRLAGSLADALGSARELPTGPMAASPPADAAWWGSTGPHLRLRAVAASRGKADAGADELSRFLLSAARVASPLDAAVRLDSSRREGTPSPPSRDPLALAWHARRLREAAKPDKADAALRDALALAEAAAEGPGAAGVRRLGRGPPLHPAGRGPARVDPGDRLGREPAGGRGAAPVAAGPAGRPPMAARPPPAGGRSAAGTRGAGHRRPAARPPRPGRGAGAARRAGRGAVGLSGGPRRLARRLVGPRRLVQRRGAGRAGRGPGRREGLLGPRPGRRPRRPDRPPGRRRDRVAGRERPAQPDQRTLSAIIREAREMSMPAMIAARPTWARPTDRAAVVGGATCAVLLGLFFADNLRHFVTTWILDENYSHGFLVPLLSLYFAREASRSGPVERVGGVGAGLTMIVASMVLRLTTTFVPVGMVGDGAFSARPGRGRLPAGGASGAASVRLRGWRSSDSWSRCRWPSTPRSPRRCNWPSAGWRRTC